MTNHSGRIKAHRVPSWRLRILMVPALLSAGCAAPAGSQPTLTPAATLPDVAGSAQCHAMDGGFLPDHACTAGDVDSRVGQSDIANTICRSGYSATVRPPLSVTEPIKQERMAAYGISGPLSDYQLDHLIPLGLGGASTTKNLWPEPLNGSRGAHRKDDLESVLHQQVCSGSVPLADAQAAIATNWEDAYQRYVGPLP